MPLLEGVAALLEEVVDLGHREVRGSSLSPSQADPSSLASSRSRRAAISRGPPHRRRASSNGGPGRLVEIGEPASGAGPSSGAWTRPSGRVAPSADGLPDGERRPRAKRPTSPGVKSVSAAVTRNGGRAPASSGPRAPRRPSRRRSAGARTAASTPNALPSPSSSSTCSARWPVTTVASRQPRGGELAQERRDHGPSVDREHRLGPALGERPHAPALAGRHHDASHYPARPSERSDSEPASALEARQLPPQARRSRRSSRRVAVPPRALRRRAEAAPRRRCRRTRPPSTPSSPSTSAASSCGVALGGTSIRWSSRKSRSSRRQARGDAPRVARQVARPPQRELRHERDQRERRASDSASRRSRLARRASGAVTEPPAGRRRRTGRRRETARLPPKPSWSARPLPNFLSPWSPRERRQPPPRRRTSATTSCTGPRARRGTASGRTAASPSRGTRPRPRCARRGRSPSTLARLVVAAAGEAGRDPRRDAERAQHQRHRAREVLAVAPVRAA